MHCTCTAQQAHFAMWAILGLLALLSLTVDAQAGYREEPMEDPTRGLDLPTVKVGIIERKMDCTGQLVVQPGMFASIQAKIYLDNGKPTKGKEPLIIFKNKMIRGVNQFKFIPGIELGIVGACAFETRSIRFGPELGFPEGSKEYSIPPNSPLKAIVTVMFYFYPTGEDVEQHKAFEDADIKKIIGHGATPLLFSPEVVQAATREQFDAATKNKAAIVFLYTSRCRLCEFFLPTVDKLAARLSKGIDGDRTRSVAVVAVDATEPDANDFVKSFHAEGFPTIIVQQRDGSQQQYYGPRKVEDIIESVKNAVPKGEL